MEDRETDEVTGLFRSSISDLWYASIPRGCATSWSIFYMAQFAPERAAELYRRHVRALGRSVLGFGGFREWPADRSHGMDADSGPIVFGVGMAATGIGLGPA